MSTTDVHRMIDSKLPSGRVCTGVSMVEVYTAIIDGAEISIDAPLLNGGYSMGPEAVADLIVAQLGSTDNAAHEGGEVDLPTSTTEVQAEPPQMMRAQIERREPEEYDDGSDDDDEDDEPLFEEPPAPKAKPKKKAKAKRR